MPNGEQEATAEISLKMALFVEVCPNPAPWFRRKRDCGNSLAQFASSQLTKYITENSLLGGMPWSNFLYDECFMTYLYFKQQHWRLLREGCEYYWLVERKFSFLLVEQKDTDEGQSRQDCTHYQLPCINWPAPLMLGSCTVTAKLSCCWGAWCYTVPGVIQAPLPWCRGKTESCCYTSRFKLPMWHWHKQLQSFPNLHEIHLLLLPKKRKM